MAIQSNFPAIRPSLLLDFANSKRLDPRVTFTRASTARYYDGSTVAKAEENLFLQSQTFSNAAWLLDGVTLSTVTAPDGTSTASKVLPSATNADHYLYGASTNRPKIANQTYTLSVFAKADGYNYITLALAGTTGVNFAAATFELTGSGAVTKTGVGGTSGSVTSTSIAALSGGWYRCAIIGIGSATQSGGFDVVSVATTGTPTYGAYGKETFTGDGTSGVQVWGAQLEQRSAVTAYTPTTTQPITNYVPVLQTAAAGVPRFDHNPITGESLGLLIEEARTNLALRSDDFSNATWSKTGGTVTANSNTAPDGTLTADTLVEDTSTGQHRVLQAITVSAGTTYTLSMYVKAAGRTRISVFDNSSASNTEVIYDLSNGTVVSAGAAVTASSITAVGNGWYRITASSTPAVTTFSAALRLISSGTTISYTGDGYSGVFLWGAQLEAGAFATSYIPTVAATATRQADFAIMTGTNFSSWYDAAEGTLYAEFQRDTTLPANAFKNVFSLNDGSGNNFMVTAISDGSNNMYSQINVNTAQQAYLVYGAQVVGSPVRMALAYKVNDFAAVRNAGSAITDTLGAIPIVSQFQLSTTTSNSLNGHYRKLAYYPARLTNAQLQAITG